MIGARDPRQHRGNLRVVFNVRKNQGEKIEKERT